MTQVITYAAASSMGPAKSGSRPNRLNGHPPHMMASQKVVGTTITAKCDGIGPGGLMPSPTTRNTSGAITAPATSVTTSSTSPLAGCDSLATNEGLAPQITTAIT